MSNIKSSKIVYITGCLGFIGIHVTKMCLDQGWYVIGVDNMTYASNINWLEKFNKHKNFVFLEQDINNLEPLRDCDYFINIAAETHVDNSIMSSEVFMHSNVNGVHHILELIRRQPKHRRPVLIHFSTDEVYGDIEHGAHTELDMLKPSNPYSASKAAADMLISAWARTYDINYVLLRPTNNYGVGQYVEKLIPKSIKYLNLGKKIDLHDRGEPRRTWLHADDTAQAVLAVIDSESTNEIFNISGNIELPNKEVIKKILSRIPGHGAEQKWEDFITNSQRSGQDVRYSINDSKLKTLGWTAKANFDVELDRIVEYYTENFIW